MSKLFRALLVVLPLTVVGCQTAPPVQEMSDARQAIAVAKDAGAESNARSELEEAEELLHRAKLNLAERLYGEARQDAVSARRRALDALAVAEAGGFVPR